MAHKALYRRYRPQVFEEIIGQEHVTRTLMNQIKTGKIGHAYLFSGSRGTGKTTAAKVFARAVNCTESKTGSPCCKCEACLNFPNIDIL
ncbi:MAG: DNA polymerase III subunit gamma/tau, partial [Clostridiales bacterium]|nr:DNA polymerase III subunit gamma/tau [Clostridiales bacterium]